MGFFDIFVLFALAYNIERVITTSNVGKSTLKGIRWFDMVIPKIIHYCWFGQSQMPELAIYCINSWKKYLPDYEFILWNEDNFDINCNEYVKEAYESKNLLL